MVVPDKPFRNLTVYLPGPYRNESDMVRHCLQALEGALCWADVVRMASPWVQAVRDDPPPFWAMESLLQEYPIASSEGLALMRLAEALLRVPDATTAIALTADQLGQADFHAGAHTDSALARLSHVAMALSKKFLPEADGTHHLASRLGARAVVAAAVRAVQLLGRQFVLGETIETALAESDRLHHAQPAVRFSFDMLGEGARTASDVARYLAQYTHAIARIAEAQSGPHEPASADGISIKLSALHPRFEEAQRDRVLAELVPHVWGLCAQAARANLNLTIDAEEADRLELSLAVCEALCSRVAAEFPGWTGFGLAMQAYQTRALDLANHAIATARRHRIRLMCRLVKGAYWDGEIKRAQEAGLPHYPVFTHKHHTDISYLACARALLAAPDAVFPQFATHNAGTVAALLQMAAHTGAPCELQRLHGMGEGVYREVQKNSPVRCRVYAPVGQHRDLLAYLVRRLLENGAHASFVHQLADPALGLEALLRSPLQPAPGPAIALPAGLFGPGRPNSQGLDLAVGTDRNTLLQALQTTRVPVVAEAAGTAVEEAMQRSLQAWPAWRDTPVADRAGLLRRAAQVLQDRLPALCAVLVQEACKTWADAVAEVREAIDFLRYYAGEAERIMAPIPLPAPWPGVTGETNTLRLVARGPWVCISPWNFPLAIFTGQVAAAVVTGNTVLAKPAEQTPGVARMVVDVLREAGLPADVVQLLHGPGDTVGARLVAHAAVAGVVFTGSTAVAKTIQRALAAKDGPIVPFIAETGGINAMLVDSSALPEQVVDAVVHSAFRSAGQRCSALRLLCLHDSVATPLLDMLAGAVRELRVGDPALLRTDLGPLIDAEAHARLQAHLQRLHATARPLWPACDAGLAAGAPPYCIAPQAFEVASVADVAEEVFGPVLQVVRWSGDPAAMIDQINRLGYGLTLGIQTRIDSRAQALARQAQVGNVYVNRNMVGAVVGLQPFGGAGLSGTGPKAGGPHYLYRFCAEQTVTVNTTAAGGNIALLG